MPKIDLPARVNSCLLRCRWHGDKTSDEVLDLIAGIDHELVPFLRVKRLAHIMRALPYVSYYRTGGVNRYAIYGPEWQARHNEMFGLVI